jgi:hypothetical protein
MKKNYYSIVEIGKKVGIDPKKIMNRYWSLLYA